MKRAKKIRHVFKVYRMKVAGRLLVNGRGKKEQWKKQTLNLKFEKKNKFKSLFLLYIIHGYFP